MRYRATISHNKSGRLIKSRPVLDGGVFEPSLCVRLIKRETLVSFFFFTFFFSPSPKLVVIGSPGQVGRCNKDIWTLAVRVTRGLGLFRAAVRSKSAPRYGVHWSGASRKMDDQYIYRYVCRGRRSISGRWLCSENEWCTLVCHPHRRTASGDPSRAPQRQQQQQQHRQELDFLLLHLFIRLPATKQKARRRDARPAPA